MQVDDVALLPSNPHYAVCLVCWKRNVGDERPIPKDLRQMVEADLAGMFASDWWDKSG